MMEYQTCFHADTVACGETCMLRSEVKGAAMPRRAARFPSRRVWLLLLSLQADWKCCGSQRSLVDWERGDSFTDREEEAAD
jgi:hypothetical protein